MGSGVGHAVKVSAISGCPVRSSAIAVCSGIGIWSLEHDAKSAANSSETAMSHGGEHDLPLLDLFIAFLYFSSVLQTASPG
jgi:hypothetical protein